MIHTLFGTRRIPLWIACTLLVGCAANPQAPNPDPLGKEIDPATKTTLAYSQLGVLRYFHVVEKIEAGEVDETRADLCAWLAEEIEVLIRLAYEVPVEFHARTRKVLKLLSDRPIACPQSNRLKPKIQAALNKLRVDGIGQYHRR